MPTPKQPTGTRSFTQGASIASADTLLDWLNTHAKDSGKRIRLPVVVRFQDDYQIAIQDTYIGTASPPNKDTVYLKLDSSRMGISLMTHLKTLCPAKTIACAVWVEGQWGQSGKGRRGRKSHSSTSEGPKKWPFSVRDVHAYEAPPSGEVYVLIEES